MKKTLIIAAACTMISQAALAQDAMTKKPDADKGTEQTERVHELPNTMEMQTPPKITLPKNLGKTDNATIPKTNISGTGAIETQEGEKFIGELKNGTATEGTIIYKSGDVYDGEMKEFKPHGGGRMEYEQGDTYQGMFKDGKRNGWGIYVTPSGDVIDGEWKEDNIDDGTVTIKYISGGMFQGTITDGEIKGSGKYTFRDGDTVEGDFISGTLVTAYCIYTFRNGAKFIGTLE